MNYSIFKILIRCKNLIARMTQTKMCTQAHGNIPISAFLRSRLDMPFVAKQQRKFYVFILYCYQHERNLEQLVNINFCLKIDKRSSEIFALIKVTYDAMRKLSAFKWHDQFKEVSKMCTMLQGVDFQKYKEAMWTECKHQIRLKIK